MTKNNIRQSDVERFTAKICVDFNSGCWNWQAGKTQDNYGKFKLAGKTEKAHRVSYVLFKTDIPAGYSVLHKCDNSLCVNPQHLYLGSHKRNMRDRVRRGRHPQAQKTSCKNGHEYTDETMGVYNLPDGKSARYCKICRRASQREYYKRTNQSK